MTSNICYAVVYFIESLISLYYFDFKFKRKIAKKFIFLFALGNFIILYILHSRFSSQIPILILITISSSFSLQYDIFRTAL